MVTLPTLERLTDYTDDSWGLGFLRAADRSQTLPLKGVTVRAKLTSMVASVNVVQTFTNCYGHPIEALYTFPLSGQSAVHDVRVTVGDRILIGKVQEKAKARQTYEQGMHRGHRSVLVEQERDNVFTANVGNIAPGETVKVELTYAEKLVTAYGETEFRFPTTIAPRFIPAGVFDGERINPPNGSNDARLDLEVRLVDCPASIRSSQHAMRARADGEGMILRLDSPLEKLDRDLVLRFNPSRGERIATRFHRQGDHFLMAIHPPAKVAETGMGKDVVILFDRSGSMSGWKMESCRRAVLDYLDRLNPSDRYLLAAFDDRIETFSDEFQPAWSDGAARRWVSHIGSRGGTDIRTPLERVMRLNFDPDRQPIVVLMTDGQVGNEDAIYRVAQNILGRLRVFTLGIGSAVNDAFLRRVAELGRGSCELVTAGDKLQESVRRLADETGTPVLVDIEVDGNGVSLEDLVPDRVPDLYAGRPVYVTGRLRGEGAVTIKGRLNGSQAIWECRVESQEGDNEAIPILWARDRVRQLEDDIRLSAVGSVKASERRITELGLEFRLLTRFTSFVVVDQSEVVAPWGCETVVQPGESPADHGLFGACFDAGAAMVCAEAAPAGDLFCAPSPAAPPPSSGTWFGEAPAQPVMRRKSFGDPPRRGLTLGGGEGRMRAGLSRQERGKPMLGRPQAPQENPFQKLSRAIDQHLANRLSTRRLAETLEQALLWLRGRVGQAQINQGRKLLAGLRSGADTQHELAGWFRQVKLTLAS